MVLTTALLFAANALHRDRILLPGIAVALARVSQNRTKGDESLIAFMESLANGESAIQMSRADLITAHDKRAARSKLVAAVQRERMLVQGFQSEGLQSLTADPESAKAAGPLDAAFKDLIPNLQSIEALESSDAALITKRSEWSAWHSHGRAFVGVLLAGMKLPHFSMRELSAPVAYNLSPLLYEGAESAIFADTSAPDKVRVGRTFAGRDSLLRQGDEIIAFRDPDEKEWTTVKTWRDILHTPKDADAEIKQQINLRIRRGHSLREVQVGFVASMINVD